MNYKTKKSFLSVSIIAASIATSIPVVAQSTAPGRNIALEEIIVTARRREESLQDIPITVNVLSGRDLADLEIRDVQDLEGVIPGLDFSQTTFASQVSLRGVEMDTAKSGFSATVETYLNDAPLQLTPLLKTMYDMGQIEVLRGPQGTLRGRASPSGSMTFSTRLPDLEEMGGYIDVNISDTGKENVNGAISVPIIADKLALRLAAVRDINEQTRVESLNSDVDPEGETTSWRATVLFQPTEDLRITYRHEDFSEELEYFTTALESMSIIDPSWINLNDAPYISADDRLTLADTPNTGEMDFTTDNLQVQWDIGSVRLNYVGQYHDRTNWTTGPNDTTNLFQTLFGPGLPQQCSVLPGAPPSTEGVGCYGGRNAGLQSDGTQESHEIRLSSTEGLFNDTMNYTIGWFNMQTDSPSSPHNRTHLIVDLPTITPASTSLIAITPIERTGENEENSFFAHTTWQLGQQTELAVGARYIDYQSDATLSIGGVINPLATEAGDESDTIWTVSLTHDWTEDFMTYASIGTSWRYTMLQVGDFSLVKSPQQLAFQAPGPESSTNFEIGFKSDWMDDRLRLNGTVFYQDFEDYPYSSGNGTWYVYTSLVQGELTESVNSTTQFVGASPVEVYGVELEAAFQATERWNISGTFAWSEGEVTDGYVPCNDYFPRDGIPDTSTQMPTVEQIRSATGGENISGCNTSIDAFEQPSWNASLRTDYWFPVGDTMEAFLRAQASIYGDSDNVVLNEVDNQSGYQVWNFYAGLRSAEGTWEVTAYVKNAFDEDAITSRSSRQLTEGYRSLIFGPRTLDSDYRATSLIPEQEFGASLRYRFGGG